MLRSFWLWPFRSFLTGRGRWSVISAPCGAVHWCWHQGKCPTSMINIDALLHAGLFCTQIATTFCCFACHVTHKFGICCFPVISLGLFILQTGVFHWQQSWDARHATTLWRAEVLGGLDPHLCYSEMWPSTFLLIWWDWPGSWCSAQEGCGRYREVERKCVCLCLCMHGGI